MIWQEDINVGVKGVMPLANQLLNDIPRVINIINIITESTNKRINPYGTIKNIITRTTIKLIIT